jgi:hypothetical protein
VGGIEWHIGGARREHAEHRHDLLDRPVTTDADPGAPADTEIAQPVGKAARPVLEVRVSERPRPVRHRHRGGRARGLLREERGHRPVGGVVGARGVPLHEDLPTLGVT